jgi:hypothetical protein
MNKKIWAALMVTLLVLCPVAITCVANESSSTESLGESLYDPGDGDGGNNPDGIGGNDPEHPQ